jgi:hypothetical protein
MLTQRSREGWLMIDNRAAGEGMVEMATSTCSHCQRVVILNPDRTRARGFCRKCNHYVCDNPTCNIECVPMEKVFDTLQERAFKNG